MSWPRAAAGLALPVAVLVGVFHRGAVDEAPAPTVRRVVRAPSERPSEHAVRLVVKSLPGGASAWVEGTYVGETPLEVEVEAGPAPVSIELELPDFERASVMTDLVKARLLVVQRLTPARGRAPSPVFLARRAPLIEPHKAMPVVATRAVAPPHETPRLDGGLTSPASPVVVGARSATRGPTTHAKTPEQSPAAHLAVAARAPVLRAPESAPPAMAPPPTQPAEEKVSATPIAPVVVQTAPVTTPAAPVPAPAAPLSSDDDLEEAEPPVPDDANEAPDYPEAARSRAVEARTVLRVMVDARGGVASVTPLTGEEPFVSAAIAAVKTWRYQPAMLRGRPITYRMVVTVRFRLDRSSNFQ